jgi:hypothetical protein
MDLLSTDYYKGINPELPPVWILTFNRPVALSRLVAELHKEGFRVNVFSNYPRVTYQGENVSTFMVDETIINTLNSEESNSWCARSWNTIFMKGFAKSDEIICIQDDTMVGPNFAEWILEQKKKYDFISGPAGDQFFYIKKSVLQKVGWWDERYLCCYCGDADYFKRVYMEYDRSRISMEDTHNWGMLFNPSGVIQNIITTYQSKTIDPNYDNQHWEMEKLNSNNPTLRYCQKHFRDKWDIDLDINKPVIDHTERHMQEIDWYPAFSKKFGITYYSI